VEEKARQFTQLLKTLANETRLILLHALLESPKTAGELTKQVPGITQSALSQHLQLLRAQGILDFSAYGQSITYSIADDRAADIVALAKKYVYAEELTHGAETAQT